MSSKKDTTYYTELQPGDAVQDGDQWLDSFGQWQPYVCNDQISGVVFSGVKARRPIRTTHQTTYEEVPGSRTLQQAVEQPQRERIAYEELRPGDIIQAGDEFRDADGRWHAYDASRCGSCVYGAWGGWARRPYKITAILEIGDALADAQKAATQLQSERDEFQTALIEARLALKRKVAEVMEVCKERDDALTALKSAQRARDELQLQVDELRAGLMGVVSAEHVHSMLEDMLDQTEWVGQCLDSSTYEQMSCIQRTISVIGERVRDMVKEATSAND